MENNISVAQILSLTTCEDIDNLLKDLNASYYESQDKTREAFINFMRTSGCIAKPYPGIQGMKKWILTIILCFFLIFGLIGNTLSATIMFKRSRRGLSSYFYLALLAIMDICVLYSGCLLFMLEVAFNYHPQLHTKFYCRFGFYFQHLFTYISAWLIVAVTFERFIVVRFPFQSIRICRMHVAYTLTSIIIIFFSIYTTHCFFTLDVTRVPIQTDDGYHPHYYVCDLLDTHKQLLSFIDLCFYSILPSLLIIIFNILIIITMFYAIKQRRNYLQASSGLLTTNTSPGNLNKKTKSSSSTRTPFFRSRSVESALAGRSFIFHGRIHHSQLNKNGIQQKSQKVLFDSTSATGIRLTCLLLLISFIFVFCTLPISIRLIVADYMPKYKTTARWQNTQLFLTLLMFLNHTINFVLYCLTGRAFRNECRKILRGLWSLKDIHVSCVINSDSNKHYHYHQQLLRNNRNHGIILQQQQKKQRMKRSYL